LLQQQQLKQQQQQQQTLPASMAAAVAATNTNASAQSHVAPAQAHAEPPTLVPAPNSHRHASSTVPAAAMTAAVAQHTQQQHHAASAAPVPAPAPAPAAAPAGVLAQTSGAAAGAADPDAAAAAAAAASRPLVPGAVRPHMTPAEALRVHGARLTSFEQSEILEYGHVWFTGPNARKIRGIPHTANNNGYDDERGDYKFVLGDHIEYRYEVLAMYGKGSFGQVARVYDYKKDSIVALKIIRNKKRFHHQALVEIRILEHLMNRDREHKSNIVRVYGYFYFRNHLCITFEPLSLNLYEYIKANNFRGMSLSLVRRMAHQLLQTLSFLIKENTIHCDLKPENILLKSTSKSNIRVIDFGSSCFANECVYTYIQSRFYRSPEVILGCSYGLPIDMWSLGCILVELHTGYPIFPGEDETEQIQCIMEIFGLPPQRMLATATRRKAFFDDAGRPKVVPNSRGKVRHVASKDLAEAARTTDARFLSFIRECLQWDPAQRLTPDQGLLHPFITERESLAATTPGAGASAAVTPGVAVATPAIPAVAGSAYGSSASTTGSSSTAARSTLPGGGNSSIVSVANSQSQFSAASSQRAPSPSGFVGSEATVAGAPTPKGSVGVYAGSSGFHAAAASAADGAARHA
jgi:dual specificity tyrosine-phosphorylation-regulated kinase 2/3/4